MISSGSSLAEIAKKFHVTIKVIERISKKIGLLNQLKINSKKCKSALLIENGKRNRIDVMKNIDILYGNKIKSIIDSGGILNTLKTQIKLPVKQLNYYLDYKGWNIIRKENSKKYIGNIARENGKKAAITLSGVPLTPLTPKIINRFCELKSKLLYKQKVYDALKKEFGLWGRKTKQLCEKYGYPLDNPQTGKLNPMFGKSPGKNAGIGVKCWVLINGNRFFCRSSLELKVMCYLNDKKTGFQISRHRVPYIDERGLDKTYCPDIVIDNTIYEIKPYNMLQIKSNIVKSNALKEYCHKFGLTYGGYITETRIYLSKYNFSYFKELICQDLLIIDNINLNKLNRNII
jgi:hypothetical protein